jgi:hypothetical protein
MRVDLVGSVVASGRRPHLPPQGSYLTPDDREGRAAFGGFSDDGIFFLLFRSGAAFTQKMDSDDSEPVGKTNTRSPREEKGKVKGKSY